MGLNNAVMVRSGVANANGVGEATKGKLQASIDNASATMARIGNLFIFTPTSRDRYTTQSITIIDDLDPNQRRWNEQVE